MNGLALLAWSDRAVVGGEADAGIAMVEGIVGLEAELDRGALGQLVGLEDRHVPDVEAGRADGIAAHVCDGADASLDKASGRIRGDVTDDVAVGASRGSGRSNARRAACAVVADRVDDRPGESDARGIEDGAVAGDVAVGVGIGARKWRDWLARLREIGAAPLPSIGDRANESVIVVDGRQIVDPSDRELTWQVERGTAAFIGVVEAVLRAARIHVAAEEFVGGVVDIFREGVVRAEIQTLRETVDEVAGDGVVDAGTDRRERSHAAEETGRGQIAARRNRLHGCSAGRRRRSWPRCPQEWGPRAGISLALM